MPQHFRVAICGGGIASLCLAHALANKCDQWEVKIFEAGSELRDEGAAIGLGSNAQTALSLISHQLRVALDEAGGTRMDPSVRIMMAAGPNSGQHVGDIRPEIAQVVVHRGRFWRALASRVPPGTLHLGKRLIDIDYTRHPMELHFEDGSCSNTDVVIGCDGINSIVRRIILGTDPAATPKYGNGYNHRAIIPLGKAIEAFGEDYCNLRTQHGWVGKDGFLLTDFVDDGQSMQVIAGWTKGEVWPHQTPFVEWSKDRLRSDLQGWGEIGKAMTKVFTEQPKLFAAGGRMHLDTPTYFKDSICVAGDAAQAFPPFQGAGAGQAIEDALILSTVLRTITKSTQIPKALEAYDAIRRPRRASIAKSSIWAAMLFTGRLPGVELDIEQIATKLSTWGDNIYNVDLEAAQREALRHLK